MLGKFAGLAATIASLISMSNGQTPCYGYGTIVGEPSNYLEDDLDKVKQLKVGQTIDGAGKNYLSSISYLFEGKTMIQANYRNSVETDFRDYGVRHGAKELVKAYRYNLRSKDSIILNPGAIVSKKV